VAGKSNNVSWRGFIKQPEARAFWYFLPFLAAVLIIDFDYLKPLFLTFLTAGIMLALAAVLFLTLYRASRANQFTALERNQLKAIVGSMDDAILAYDENFKMLFFNAAAERIFGVSAGAVLGLVITPQDGEKPLMRRLVQTAFPSLAPTMVPRSPAGEYPQIIDVTFDAPEIYLRTVTSPIYNDSGRVFGFMKLIHDRTREVTLLKSKSEFITVASHQLRTPLTRVSWALQALSGDAEIKEESKNLISNALEAATQLSEIIDDLLNVSKIEEGRFGYEFQKMNPSEFLEKIVADAASQARRVGVKIYFEKFKEPLPDAFIDEKKLKMAMINLLDNGVRYNVKNGEVKVSIAPAEESGFLEITVKDTGIGIPESEKEKLFSKFFRASNAAKYAPDGSGLGLYIIQNIIASHGGKIWVESEENRGTTLHVTIPTDPRLLPKHEVPVEY